MSESARRAVARAWQRPGDARSSSPLPTPCSRRWAIASQPRGLVSIEDAGGDEVDRVHIEREQVLSEQVAYQMVSMLQDVTRRGTAASLQRQGLPMEVGGKTGTTNDSRDAWFVGFSSSVVVGVWIGFDQPQTIRSDASGSRMALPIWADFMRRTARRLPAEPFEPPDFAPR